MKTKHLDEILKKAKEIADTENPIKEYKWDCGCRILGKPPIVSKIVFCSGHRYLADQLEKIGPHSAKKILSYWEVMKAAKAQKKP